MEDYIKITNIEMLKSLDGVDYQLVHKVLGLKDGVVTFSIDDKVLRVEFNSYLISLSEIKETLEAAGYVITETKKASRFQKFIQTLAKTNQKSFGSGKLECCKLND